MAGNEYSLMKRQIIIKLFGDEIVNVLIEETDDEAEESEEVENLNGLTTGSDASVTNRGSIGFNTPWSVEYWDDED
jgi:hypothetical protein